MNSTLKTIALATLGGAITLGSYKAFIEEPTEVKEVYIESPVKNIPSVQTKSIPYDNAALPSFNVAAENALNSVVHVKVASERTSYGYNDPFEYFFGMKPKERSQIVYGAGSGVIISEKGYIVTNDHVIKGAKNVVVTLNDNRELKAKVIGTDPNTDIALIKVEGENLIPVTFSNSDEVVVGDWVLAVGNPFNLTSTVTAGIVSAKGRNIGILENNASIESFIQTDAAVNPGNSGGALVNTNGELVGINTAISTHTGSFEGYSFAVPANIVKKVVEDIMEFGTVQRGFIGVSIVDVNQPLVDEMELRVNNGVYVAQTVEGGSAEDAGIKRGDVIIKLDNTPVKKSSELMEYVGSRRPGDNVTITVDRNGTTKVFEVTLKNKDGNTNMVPKEELNFNRLGGVLVELTDKEKTEYGVRNGLKITDIKEGKFKDARIPEGFIIVKVNNKYVRTVEEFEIIISNLSSSDGVLIQGYSKDGKADYFAFDLSKK